MKFSGIIISLSIVSIAALVASCSKTEESKRRGLQAEARTGGATTLIRFDYTKDEINAACSAEKQRVEAALDKIATLKPSDVTFENSVLELEKTLTALLNNIEPPNFLKYVSPDKELREVAGKCEELVSKLYVDIFSRADLYKVLGAVDARPLAKGDSKLLEEYLSDFRRNGLELPEDERKEYVQKSKRLVELTTEFSKNLNEWSDPTWLTREELDGMSDGFISGLEEKDGKFKLTLAYPHYYPFMQDAKNGDVRRRLQLKFFNRGGDRNRELLEEAVALRHEMAQMLGYATHAEYVVEKRMAKKPAEVTKFLENLISKLNPKGKQDLAELLEIKRAELNDPSIDQIHAWDWRYYANQLIKQKYQVDQNVVKEYFPLDVVMDGMFEIYQTLLGVTFEETTDVPVWHDSVAAYAVKKNGKAISYFYMDLFPREGKYNHAAAFTLQKGHTKADGSYHIPISSVVANFNAPTAENPSLLLHSQVETLFHEFGHIMHQILTTAKYGSFSGTSVKRDFVEAPSQMLENWVWKKAPLAKLSGHYQDKTKPLPDALLDKMLKAKLANSGIRYLRQLFFATLDMTYHTSASVDSTQVYRDLIEKIMLIPIPEGTQPQASFGHLMGGYDAGYYGYLWSEVYAQDMFTRFDKEGLLNPETGKDYLEWILQPGGSQDPFELIKGFLGREPNQAAFLKSLGLS